MKFVALDVIGSDTRCDVRAWRQAEPRARRCAECSGPSGALSIKVLLQGFKHRAAFRHVSRDSDVIRGMRADMEGHGRAPALQARMRWAGPDRLAAV